MEKIVHSTESEANYKNADKEAVLHEIMDLYSKTVFLLAYSFVKDKGMAEDISQEVFIRCYKHLEKYRAEASLKSWIYRITINTSKDFLKKRSNRLLTLGSRFFDNDISSESSEDIYIRHSENEELLRKVLSLPIKYREVIVLHYFWDQKVEEMAELLDVNANTVKTRLARGRSKLKNQYFEKKGEIFFERRT